ncbi:cytochrome c oxidase accessory protein FixG [Neolewinella xylanilytica]|uniref:Cytochrome c oxidase accessory protein FixG n=1 Tax=Neolewinella xylanilytica TaxID=1514080 RepID=A0A2S6I7Y2_9BACT|nr:4Fe-4S dicluster domain-containing protein [Neolewinella xylanilytica]PPK87601.1 cytochrome c oxidase accessory protein FixG [Neolewinella xylanilytica]
MSIPQPPKDDFRNHIATVDEAGKRLWVFPKQPEGRFYQRRTLLSYLLLAILFGLPWIRVGGEPVFLFNVLERRFILFGLHFTPQDFHLFALLMVTAMVFIVLFTVVFGRLFCGWVCPQTTFMEMVFRKIEYWIEGDANAQKRLAKAPWTPDKVRKKALKHGLFLLVSALIAHTFLAYIIGTDGLLEIVQQSPLEAPGGFLAIVAFIGIFYAVFSYMREQVCIAVCPYGRLQGVLLDDDSVNVIYDYERGEPRGKIDRGQPKRTSCTSCASCRENNSACTDRILQRMEDNLTGIAPPPPKGDCIDCGLCVQVCPTGIDIRNGIQMECINCTACIDACDAVMDKVDRPRGLIRYDSERGVREGKRRIWTPRAMAYSALLLALVALNVWLLSSRDGVDVILLRAPGSLYHTEADTAVSNLYTYQVVNKTGLELPLTFVADGGRAEVRTVGGTPAVPPGEIVEGALFLVVPADGNGYPDEIVVSVRSGGEELKRITTSFLHPSN